MISQKSWKSGLTRGVEFSITFLGVRYGSVITVEQKAEKGGVIGVARVGWSSNAFKAVEYVRLFSDALNQALEIAESWNEDIGKDWRMVG